MTRAYKHTGYPGATVEVRPVCKHPPTRRAEAWLTHIAMAYQMAPEGSEEEAHLERTLVMACSRMGLDAADLLSDYAGIGQLDDDELQRGGS